MKINRFASTKARLEQVDGFTFPDYDTICGDGPLRMLFVEGNVVLLKNGAVVERFFSCLSFSIFPFFFLFFLFFLFSPSLLSFSQTFADVYGYDSHFKKEPTRWEGIFIYFIQSFLFF